MHNIKILHLTFDMAIGGAEQVIRQLVTNIDPDRFTSIVGCIDGKVGEIGQLLSDKGIEVMPLARKPGFDRKLIKMVRDIIKTKDIDIVHCHQYTPYVYGFFGAMGTNAKVIFTEHGRFYPDSYRIKRLITNPFISRLTCEVTAISEATKDALVKYEFFPRKKIKVIYNGILPPEFNDEKKQAASSLKKSLGLASIHKIVGTVSRLDSVKNQKMMIDAFNQALAMYPDLRLLIVGDGPLRSELEQQVNELDINEKVIFTGFKTDPLLYMSIMDIFLLSSFTEGTSMTLLEAMSLCKPCIVTDVGGNPEIVEHKVSGLVVPNDDATGFTTAIINLLADSEKMISFGNAAKDRFSNLFNINKMVDSFSKLYAKHAICSEKVK